MTSSAADRLRRILPYLTQHDVNAQFSALFFYHFDFRFGIRRKFVDGYHTRQSEVLCYVFHVLQQIRQTFFQSLQVFLSQVSLELRRRDISKP